MGLKERVAAEKCPFLRPGLATGPLTIAMYCGLPGGRVKLPSRDEIERYCAPGAFERCPTYRRYAGR